MGQRLLSLDFIKLFAMFGVICLHTEMNFYENPLAQFLYMTAVVSIPLFFMTSGYLLYGKQSVDYHYSAHKIVGIFAFCCNHDNYFLAVDRYASWRILLVVYGWQLDSKREFGNILVFWSYDDIICSSSDAT